MKKKFNLLLMTPVTAPMFLLGFRNESTTLIILGFLLMAIFIISGFIQIGQDNKQQ